MSTALTNAHCTGGVSNIDAAHEGQEEEEHGEEEEQQAEEGDSESTAESEGKHIYSTSYLHGIIDILSKQ